MFGQKSTVKITLNRFSNTVAKAMDPLGQWFLDVPIHSVVVLGQLCGPGRDQRDGPASIFGFAGQQRHEHPRSPDFHASAKILLKSQIAYVFGFEFLSLGQDLVAELAVCPTPLCREFSLLFYQSDL
jgi:hypothetical protein